MPKAGPLCNRDSAAGSAAKWPGLPLTFVRITTVLRCTMGAGSVRTAVVLEIALGDRLYQDIVHRVLADDFDRRFHEFGLYGRNIDQ